MSTAGARLKALRESIDFQQKDLAKRMGKPGSWVHNRESGKIRMSVEEAEEMIRAMGFSAAMVIRRGDLDAFMRAVDQAAPEDLEAAALLLRAWPHIGAQARSMILGHLKHAVDHAPAEEDPGEREAGAG